VRTEKFKHTFSWWVYASVSGAYPIMILKLSHHDMNQKCYSVSTVFKIWCRYETDMNQDVHPEMPLIIFPTFPEILISQYTQNKAKRSVKQQRSDVLIYFCLLASRRSVRVKWLPPPPVGQLLTAADRYKNTMYLLRHVNWALKCLSIFLVFYMVLNFFLLWLEYLLAFSTIFKTLE